MKCEITPSIGAAVSMASSSLLSPLSAGSITRPTTLPQPTRLFRIISLPRLPQPRRRTSSTLVAKAGWWRNPGPQQSKNPQESTQAAAAPARGEEEVVEEDLPWIQEKALDLVEFTGTVTQAIPGPRVAQSQIPWLLAVPLAWVGLSFVIGFVKAVRNEDADILRMHTQSETDDIESAKKMVDDSSLEEDKDGSSSMD
ncbi:hypothetical protein B296_00045706 [Ensete ventricosum]|uniref:Uncharacterized protein n=1 Tax=Ensete ventricosum TaxID=4639 RepID=A0A426Y9R4_ENSVE|nr:hypothetical protein B296_00045706 [Ensete ventricosum]